MSKSERIAQLEERVKQLEEKLEALGATLLEVPCTVVTPAPYVAPRLVPPHWPTVWINSSGSATYQTPPGTTITQ